jgi:purine-nucleoside phosphorylase
MTEHVTHAALLQAAATVRACTRYNPSVGLVLGSGLNPLAERLVEPDIIPYGEIPHFPRSTVPGHSGRLLLGRLGGKVVMVMQGRAHFYEGYSTGEITLPIRVMQLMGVSTLIVTNAAGGIKSSLKAGDLMAITDHINLVGLAGHNPLRGPNDDSLGVRFPSMWRAYDPALLDLLRAEAREQGIALQEGIYAMVAGPSFETPAEIRFLRTIGADAVGMSTVPEVIVARHGGLSVLGVSLISNVALDSLAIAQEETSHEQVLEAGRQAAPALAKLVEGVLARLP